MLIPVVIFLLIGFILALTFILRNMAMKKPDEGVFYFGETPRDKSGCYAQEGFRGKTDFGCLGGELDKQHCEFGCSGKSTSSDGGDAKNENND